MRKIAQEIADNNTDKARAESSLQHLIQLETLISAANNEQKKAKAVSSDDPKKADCQRLDDQLTTFVGKLPDWRGLFIGLTAGEATANARLRFNDAGTWAVHFSMVRMTMTTFFVAAAWGVVSLKWNEYNPILCLAALGVWVLAGMFLLLFTFETFRKSKIQKIWQNKLPTVKSPSSGKGLRRGAFMMIWVPVLLYGVATWGYFVLLQSWARHNQARPITLAGLYHRFSTSETQKELDDVPRLSKSEEALESLVKSLEEIKTRLPNANTTSPTPVQVPTVSPTAMPQSVLPPNTEPNSTEIVPTSSPPRS